MNRDRVLIVSAQPLFREGILRLLGEGAEVVGTVADWEAARALIRQYHVGTLIVDHTRPELEVGDLAPLLWPEVGSLRVIYLTLAGNELIVHERRRITGATENDLLHALKTTTLPEPGLHDQEGASPLSPEAGTGPAAPSQVRESQQKEGKTICGER